MSQFKQMLWTEKYRPKTIDQCLLPKSIKKQFQAIVENGNMPHLLLSGRAGIGKTTVAKALAHQMDMDCLVINGSLDRNIDTLRNDIHQFVRTIAFNSNMKMVILDEADYLNATSFQPALRNFMEEFSSTTRFVLTCNYKHRIIEPLQSRCTAIDFVIPHNDIPNITLEAVKRIKSILSSENIQADDRTIVAIVKSHFPDLRRMINEAQRLSTGGSIDPETVFLEHSTDYDQVISSLKKGDFLSIRKWVSDNTHIDQQVIFSSLYPLLYKAVTEESIPSAIMILGEYQYKATVVVDPEINVAACFMTLAKECRWK